jgi:hypothetical protein
MDISVKLKKIMIAIAVSSQNNYKIRGILNV